MNTLPTLLRMLARRLTPQGARWFDAARGEIARGVNNERFCALFSLGSRFAPRGLLQPSPDELQAALAVAPGWNPQRWTSLEALRVALVLSRADLAQPEAVAAIEELFRYADMGELCAGYKLLAHLPGPERFVWRAGEGARSSMKAVYESACCDTSFPEQHFDAIAWRQAVIKALFIEAPLWRVGGVDRRLDAELARIALDLADERRSAGRDVNPELWMCLGTFGGERALASLELELRGGPPRGRAGAVLGLARAGARARLESLSALERDPLVHAVLVAALRGAHDSRAFAALDPNLHGVR
ncbi:MAG: hypothetical protein FJ298_10360 [Planctomycetes bacterium]|nr:hypothetical protein [Planctomycetota bacterium]